MVTDAIAASVVVPTLGRVGPLRTCLESLVACSPRADEILVVDQSRRHEVRNLVAGFAPARARLIPCEGHGVSKGRNLGIREARNDVVLVTDDDCTVAEDWVRRAYELVVGDPNAIVTGRVLPVGNSAAVPSIKDDDAPHDFTGETHAGALFPNNMALHRSAVLAAGAFDERFGPAEAAEDNEFCYRWLKGGRSLRYDPSLVVWHHDWRTPDQLSRLYVAYARGQGFFYAKHLRQRDPRMLLYIARDLYWAARGLASRVATGRERWTDPRRGIPVGLPRGLWDGWRVYGGGRSGSPDTSCVRGAP